MLKPSCKIVDPHVPVLHDKQNGRTGSNIQDRVNWAFFKVAGEYSLENAEYLSRELLHFINSSPSTVQKSESFLELIEKRLLYLHWFLCNVAQKTGVYLLNFNLKQVLSKYVALELKIDTADQRVSRWLWIIYSKYFYYSKGQFDSVGVCSLILKFLQSVEVPPRLRIHFIKIERNFSRASSARRLKYQDLPYYCQKPERRNAVPLVVLTDDEPADTPEDRKYDEAWDKLKKLRNELEVERKKQLNRNCLITKTKLKRNTVIDLSMEDEDYQDETSSQGSTQIDDVISEATEILSRISSIAKNKEMTIKISKDDVRIQIEAPDSSPDGRTTSSEEETESPPEPPQMWAYALPYYPLDAMQGWHAHSSYHPGDGRAYPTPLLEPWNSSMPVLPPNYMGYQMQSPWPPSGHQYRVSESQVHRVGSSIDSYATQQPPHWHRGRQQVESPELPRGKEHETIELEDDVKLETPPPESSPLRAKDLVPEPQEIIDLIEDTPHQSEAEDDLLDCIEDYSDAYKEVDEDVLLEEMPEPEGNLEEPQHEDLKLREDGQTEGSKGGVLILHDVLIKTSVDGESQPSDDALPQETDVSENEVVSSAVVGEQSESDNTQLESVKEKVFESGDFPDERTVYRDKLLWLSHVITDIIPTMPPRDYGTMPKTEAPEGDKNLSYDSGTVVYAQGNVDQEEATEKDNPPDKSTTGFFKDSPVEESPISLEPAPPENLIALRPAKVPESYLQGPLENKVMSHTGISLLQYEPAEALRTETTDSSDSEIQLKIDERGDSSPEHRHIIAKAPRPYRTKAELKEIVRKVPSDESDDDIPLGLRVNNISKSKGRKVSNHVTGGLDKRSEPIKASPKGRKRSGPSKKKPESEVLYTSKLRSRSHSGSKEEDVIFGLEQLPPAKPRGRPKKAATLLPKPLKAVGETPPLIDTVLVSSTKTLLIEESCVAALNSATTPPKKRMSFRKVNKLLDDTTNRLKERQEAEVFSFEKDRILEVSTVVVTEKVKIVTQKDRALRSSKEFAPTDFQPVASLSSKNEVSPIEAKVDSFSDLATVESNVKQVDLLSKKSRKLKETTADSVASSKDNKCSKPIAKSVEAPKKPKKSSKELLDRHMDKSEDLKSGTSKQGFFDKKDLTREAIEEAKPSKERVRDAANKVSDDRKSSTSKSSKKSLDVQLEAEQLTNKKSKKSPKQVDRHPTEVIEVLPKRPTILCIDGTTSSKRNLKEDSLPRRKTNTRVVQSPINESFVRSTEVKSGLEKTLEESLKQPLPEPASGDIKEDVSVSETSAGSPGECDKGALNLVSSEHLKAEEPATEEESEMRDKFHYANFLTVERELFRDRMIEDLQRDETQQQENRDFSEGVTETETKLSNDVLEETQGDASVLPMDLSVLKRTDDSQMSLIKEPSEPEVPGIVNIKETWLEEPKSIKETSEEPASSVEHAEKPLIEQVTEQVEALENLICMEVVSRQSESEKVLPMKDPIDLQTSGQVTEPSPISEPHDAASLKMLEPSAEPVQLGEDAPNSGKSSAREDLTESPPKVGKKPGIEETVLKLKQQICKQAVNLQNVSLLEGSDGDGTCPLGNSVLNPPNLDTCEDVSMAVKTRRTFRRRKSDVERQCSKKTTSDLPETFNVEASAESPAVVASDTDRNEAVPQLSDAEIPSRVFEDLETPQSTAEFSEVFKTEETSPVLHQDSVIPISHIKVAVTNDIQTSESAETLRTEKASQFRSTLEIPKVIESLQFEELDDSHRTADFSETLMSTEEVSQLIYPTPGQHQNLHPEFQASDSCQTTVDSSEVLRTEESVEISTLGHQGDMETPNNQLENLVTGETAPEPSKASQVEEEPLEAVLKDAEVPSSLTEVPIMTELTEGFKSEDAKSPEIVIPEATVISSECHSHTEVPIATEPTESLKGEDSKSPGIVISEATVVSSEAVEIETTETVVISEPTKVSPGNNEEQQNHDNILKHAEVSSSYPEVPIVTEPTESLKGKDSESPGIVISEATVVPPEVVEIESTETETSLSSTEGQQSRKTTESYQELLHSAILPATPDNPKAPSDNSAIAKTAPICDPTESFEASPSTNESFSRRNSISTPNHGDQMTAENNMPSIECLVPDFDNELLITEDGVAHDPLHLGHVLNEVIVSSEEVVEEITEVPNVFVEFLPEIGTFKVEKEARHIHKLEEGLKAGNEVRLPVADRSKDASKQKKRQSEDRNSKRERSSKGNKTNRTGISKELQKEIKHSKSNEELPKSDSVKEGNPTKERVRDAQKVSDSRRLSSGSVKKEVKTPISSTTEDTNESRRKKDKVVKEEKRLKKKDVKIDEVGDSDKRFKKPRSSDKQADQAKKPKYKETPSITSSNLDIKEMKLEQKKTATIWDVEKTDTRKRKRGDKADNDKVKIPKMTEKSKTDRRDSDRRERKSSTDKDSPNPSRKTKDRSRRERSNSKSGTDKVKSLTASSRNERSKELEEKREDHKKPLKTYGKASNHKIPEKLIGDSSGKSQKAVTTPQQVGPKQTVSVQKGKTQETEKLKETDAKKAPREVRDSQTNSSGAKTEDQKSNQAVSETPKKAVIHNKNLEKGRRKFEAKITERQPDDKKEFKGNNLNLSSKTVVEFALDTSNQNTKDTEKIKGKVAKHEIPIQDYNNQKDSKAKVQAQMAVEVPVKTEIVNEVGEKVEEVFSEVLYKDSEAQTLVKRRHRVEVEVPMTIVDANEGAGKEMDKIEDNITHSQPRELSNRMEHSYKDNLNHNQMEVEIPMVISDANKGAEQNHMNETEDSQKNIAINQPHENEVEVPMTILDVTEDAEKNKIMVQKRRHLRKVSSETETTQKNAKVSIHLPHENEVEVPMTIVNVTEDAEKNEIMVQKRRHLRKVSSETEATQKNAKVSIHLPHENEVEVPMTFVDVTEDAKENVIEVKKRSHLHRESDEADETQKNSQVNQPHENEVEVPKTFVDVTEDAKKNKIELKKRRHLPKLSNETGDTQKNAELKIHLPHKNEEVATKFVNVTEVAEKNKIDVKKRRNFHKVSNETEDTQKNINIKIHLPHENEVEVPMTFVDVNEDADKNVVKKLTKITDQDLCKMSSLEGETEILEPQPDQKEVEVPITFVNVSEGAEKDGVQIETEVLAQQLFEDSCKISNTLEDVESKMLDFQHHEIVVEGPVVTIDMNRDVGTITDNKDTKITVEHIEYPQKKLKAIEMDSQPQQAEMEVPMTSMDVHQDAEKASDEFEVKTTDRRLHDESSETEEPQKDAKTKILDSKLRQTEVEVAVVPVDVNKNAEKSRGNAEAKIIVQHLPAIYGEVEYSQKDVETKTLDSQPHQVEVEIPMAVDLKKDVEKDSDNVLLDDSQKDFEARTTEQPSHRKDVERPVPFVDAKLDAEKDSETIETKITVKHTNEVSSEIDNSWKDIEAKIPDAQPHQMNIEIPSETVIVTEDAEKGRDEDLKIAIQQPNEAEIPDQEVPVKTTDSAGKATERQRHETVLEVPLHENSQKNSEIIEAGSERIDVQKETHQIEVEVPMTAVDVNECDPVELRQALIEDPLKCVEGDKDSKKVGRKKVSRKAERSKKNSQRHETAVKVLEIGDRSLKDSEGKKSVDQRSPQVNGELMMMVADEEKKKNTETIDLPKKPSGVDNLKKKCKVKAEANISDRLFDQVDPLLSVGGPMEIGTQNVLKITKTVENPSGQPVKNPEKIEERLSEVVAVMSDANTTDRQIPEALNSTSRTLAKEEAQVVGRKSFNVDEQSELVTTLPAEAREVTESCEPTQSQPPFITEALLPIEKPATLQQVSEYPPDLNNPSMLPTLPQGDSGNNREVVNEPPLNGSASVEKINLSSGVNLVQNSTSKELYILLDKSTVRKAPRKRMSTETSEVSPVKKVKVAEDLPPSDGVLITSEEIAELNNALLKSSSSEQLALNIEQLTSPTCLDDTKALMGDCLEPCLFFHNDTNENGNIGYLYCSGITETVVSTPLQYVDFSFEHVAGATDNSSESFTPNTMAECISTSVATTLSDVTSTGFGVFQTSGDHSYADAVKSQENQSEIFDPNLNDRIAAEEAKKTPDIDPKSSMDQWISGLFLPSENVLEKPTINIGDPMAAVALEDDNNWPATLDFKGLENYMEDSTAEYSELERLNLDDDLETGQFKKVDVFNQVVDKVKGPLFIQGGIMAFEDSSHTQDDDFEVVSPPKKVRKNETFSPLDIVTFEQPNKLLHGSVEVKKSNNVPRLAKQQVTLVTLPSGSSKAATLKDALHKQITVRPLQEMLVQKTSEVNDSLTVPENYMEDSNTAESYSALEIGPFALETVPNERHFNIQITTATGEPSIFPSNTSEGEITFEETTKIPEPPINQRIRRSSLATAKLPEPKKKVQKPTKPPPVLALPVRVSEKTKPCPPPSKRKMQPNGSQSEPSNLANSPRVHRSMNSYILSPVNEASGEDLKVNELHRPARGRKPGQSPKGSPRAASVKSMPMLTVDDLPSFSPSTRTRSGSRASGGRTPGSYGSESVTGWEQQLKTSSTKQRRPLNQTHSKTDIPVDPFDLLKNGLINPSFEERLRASKGPITSNEKSYTRTGAVHSKPILARKPNGDPPQRNGLIGAANQSQSDEEWRERFAKELQKRGRSESCL